MSFTVSNIFSTPATNFLTVGSTFDVDIPGGRLKTKAGEIVGSQLAPIKYFVAPGGTYLFCLSPGGAPGTYLIEKSWNLSNGKVEPMDPREIQRAERQKSKIDSLTPQNLAVYLKEYFHNVRN
jgi:hypothetical protein